MSISDVILGWVADGELVELTHSLGFQIVRRTIVSRDIYAFIRQGPWDTEELKARNLNVDGVAGIKARGLALYADFDHFMAGMEIMVALPNKQRPYENKNAAFLRLLHRREEEVWELRSYSAEPGLRVFGRFIERDYFAALTWDSRANLGRPPWRGARIACKTEWTRFFQAELPHSGDNLHDYLSTNAFPA